MSNGYSDFGARFAEPSGTRQLMDDLGELQRAAGQLLNLGGGNPSRVPEVHAWFGQKLKELALSGALETVFAAYDDPRGHDGFIKALSELFSTVFGRPVTRENIVCTAGSQASFFMLFNLFSGRRKQGEPLKILLPQSPEYIGYGDLPIEPDSLTTCQSLITFTAPHRFKYHIDFEHLEVDKRIGAIALSRPTNPTGNVVSDHELAQLEALAAAHDIPLIIDCAYGAPFPGIMFGTSTLTWSPNSILCFSLSKLGLPGLRTGIILAPANIANLLVSMNATMVLSNNSIGACLAQELFRTQAVLNVAKTLIRPYYQARSRAALAHCDELFAGIDYFVHESEGAIFLWVWFRGLPISAQALYERLKRRGVLVIPGHHFAPGRSTALGHVNECIRISYAQGDEVLRRGIAVIGDEVRAALDGR